MPLPCKGCKADPTLPLTPEGRPKAQSTERNPHRVTSFLDNVFGLLSAPLKFAWLASIFELIKGWQQLDEMETDEVCLDDCPGHNFNGVCNDGGPGSEVNDHACYYGHDCDDCTPRPRNACNNDCDAQYIGNGVCDEGAYTFDSYCAFGTDCNDCGVRDMGG